MLLAAGVAVLWAAPFAPVAARADGVCGGSATACVAVTVDEDPPVYLTAEDLPGGEVSESYDSYNGTRDLYPGLTSVRDLLGLVNVDPDDVTYLGLGRGARATYLDGTNGDLSSDAGTTVFADSDNNVPAISFNKDENNPQFQSIVPVRGDTSSPLFGQVQLQSGSANGGELDVVVRTHGRLLATSLSADPANSKKDPTTVTLSAATTPDVTPEKLTYHWHFGDGSHTKTTTGPVTTHAYGAGSWFPTVTVMGDEDSFGPSVYVQVSVQATTPHHSKKTQQGGGTGPPTNSRNGPVNGEGTHAGGTTVPGRSTTDTRRGTGSNTAAVRGAPGATRRATGPSAPAPGSSGSAGPRADDGRGRVEGFLLTPPSGGYVQPSRAASASRPPQAASARREVTATKGLSPVVFGVLGVLLLLGVGAFAEVRPLRQERRGRRT